MLNDDYLLRARLISPEANKLVRDILRFHPELRLSVPEISARVLRLHSFFDNPRTKSTSSELRKMMFTHRRVLAGPDLDLIARRRKELEYFRGLDETSPFNDLSSRLPLPSPPPKIRVTNLPENPLPRANKPYCDPIQGISAPVAISSPEELAGVRSKWWHTDNLKLAGSWYYP